MKLKENLSHFINEIRIADNDNINTRKKAYQRASQMILQNKPLLKACEEIIKDIKEPKNTSFEENTLPSSPEDNTRIKIEDFKEISRKQGVKEKMPTSTLEEDILKIIKTNHINE